MALSQELKDILVCPKCRGDLRFHEDRAEIHCLSCRLVYAIVDDIPVLLIDEARPLPKDETSSSESASSR